MSIKIQKKLCVPTQCKHECVEVCPQNKKGKEAIKIGKTIAEVNHTNCISCLQCVYACPFDAIEAVVKDKQNITKTTLHVKEKKGKKAKKLFEINEDIYKPFSEKYTIFSRRMWDEEFSGYKTPIFG
ncbi:MAG: 4Fe-4S binding protein, partial [Candidatus Heimdallarchaeaceae archaeon]